MTPDLVVSFIVPNHQNPPDGPKAAHITTPVYSDGIIQSIASIYSALDEGLRLSKHLLRSSSNRVDLVPTFLIQQVTFENTCKLLVSQDGRNRQDVELMFENPNHSIWANPTTENDLSRRLGRFYELCLRTLAYIRETLSGLQTRLRSLIEKIQAFKKQLWPVKSTSPGLGSINLCPRLRDLRNSNDLLFSLARQAIFSAQDQAPYRISETLADYQDISTAAPTTCDHSHCVKQASQALFVLLSKAWSCHNHGTHKLSISMKLDCTLTGGLPPSRSFHFSVVVSCSPSDEYRLSMKVASNQFCTCHTATAKEDWAYSQERIGTRVSRSSKGSPALSPCSDLMARRSGCSGRNLKACAGSMHNIARDLSTEEDLCLYLRSSCAIIESTKASHCSCLGYLAIENGLKFIVYYVVEGECRKETSYSLDDVLECASDEHRTIPVEERLRAASYLAAGVLHFHSSPWLHRVWSSKDIHYINMNGVQQENALGEPFLQTSLEESTDAQCTIGSKDPDAMRSSLVSLGLALIEIAFSAPWRHLQLEEDITRDLSGKERNFVNLMRLSETVSRELGLNYASVVQICLHELFGPHQMRKLGSAELHELIRHIVMELNGCLSAVSEDLGMSLCSGRSSDL